jgi:histidine ammonia-lyase
MTACGTLVITKSYYLAKIADLSASLSVIALQGRTEPFDRRIINLKPHPEQFTVATNLNNLLRGYEPSIKKVQDSYSLRCIPQVAGAVRQGMKFARDIIETEMNSVTDNPIIIFNRKKNDYDIISGGNFHGQAIAQTFDMLGINLTTIGLIAERRIFRLLDDKLSGLSPFLVKEPGVNSGLMMLQVLASGLCAENKVLCNPASVQSLPTSASQEDFVSMGMTAANKTRKILDNTLIILAIELICARQAIELAGFKIPKGIARFYQKIAAAVPYITDDRLFQNDITNTKKLFQDSKFQKLVNDKIL